MPASRQAARQSWRGGAGAQICSCHNVSKGISAAVSAGATNVGTIKQCTKRRPAQTPALVKQVMEFQPGRA
ncbi:MAG: hypothetical protein ACLR9W_03815 [Enterobacter hormaechei]